MKNNMKIWKFCFLITLLSFTNAKAAIFTKDKVGTTSAQFLKLAVGARPVAMGETFTGLADDVNAIYWNPAGLNQINGIEISAMYAVWFEDISFSWVACVQNGLGGKIGTAINYLWAGTINKYDRDDNELNESYNAYDIAFILSYARLIKKIPLGMNLKFINSKIEEESAMGIAADIGILKTISKIKDIKIGIAVQNLGIGLKFINERDPLPVNIRTGTYYRLLNDNLTLALDINFPIDYTINVHFGSEYRYRLNSVSVLMLRAGYKSTTVNDLDTLSGLSAGFGISSSNLGIDYAWVPYWELGSTHRLSVTFNFGQTGKSKIAKKIPIINKKLYRTGLNYMKNGKYLKATEIFIKILSINPEHPGAIKNLKKSIKNLQ